MIIQYTDNHLSCYRSLWSWGLFNVWLLLTDSLVSLKWKWCRDAVMKISLSGAQWQKLKCHFNASAPGRMNYPAQSTISQREINQELCKGDFVLFLSLQRLKQYNIVSQSVPLPPTGLSPPFIQYNQTHNPLIFGWSAQINQRGHILTGLAQRTQYLLLEIRYE